MHRQAHRKTGYIFRTKVKDLEIRRLADPKAVAVLGEIFLTSIT